MRDNVKDSEARALVEESLKLVTVPETELATKLFRELFRRHPMAEPLFATHATANRHRMMREIFELAAADWGQATWIETYLMELGERHIAYEVEPGMHDWLEECFLDTLAEVADGPWKPDYDMAWRHVLRKIRRCMTPQTPA